MNRNEEHLTLREAADALGISEVNARRWVKSGKLKAYQPGRKYLIPISAVEELLEGSTVSGKVKASDLDRLPPMARRTLNRLLRAKEDPANTYWDTADIIGMKEEFRRLGISNEAFVDWLEKATLADLERLEEGEEEQQQWASPSEAARALMHR